ncbi:hypothetical protein KIPB_010242, partial [Kipferlia bialata]
ASVAKAEAVCGKLSKDSPKVFLMSGLVLCGCLVVAGTISRVIDIIKMEAP